MRLPVLHQGLAPRPARRSPTALLWGRTLRITNGFTEGCHTKVKLLKRLSYGFRNVEVYRRKMLLGFLPKTAAVLEPRHY